MDDAEVQNENENSDSVSSDVAIKSSVQMPDNSLPVSMTPETAGGDAQPSSGEFYQSDQKRDGQELQSLPPSISRHWNQDMTAVQQSGLYMYGANFMHPRKAPNPQGTMPSSSIRYETNVCAHEAKDDKDSLPKQPSWPLSSICQPEPLVMPKERRYRYQDLVKNSPNYPKAQEHSQWSQKHIEDLKSRVYDWESHDVNFGMVVLHGIVNVGREDRPWAECHLYLFDKILLIFKQMNPKAIEGKSWAKKTHTHIGEQKAPTLQLKGRIFMRNLTSVMLKQNQAEIDVIWKGATGIERLNIRFDDAATSEAWTVVLRDQSWLCQADGGEKVGRTYVDDVQSDGNDPGS